VLLHDVAVVCVYFDAYSSVLAEVLEMNLHPVVKLTGSKEANES